MTERRPSPAPSGRRFPTTIDGPAGTLRIAVDLPASDPRACAVLCHPHTLHGGTLHNKVIHQAARAFTEAGAVAVRFDFRGAGQSAGSFDHGIGEVDDLVAVVDWVRSQWPDRPLWLAGFSFGAYVSLRAASILAPALLVSVSPPVNRYEITPLAVLPPRWLVVQGEDDDVVPADAVTAWVRALPQPPEYALIPSADHFFHGRLAPLREQVRRFAESA